MPFPERTKLLAKQKAAFRCCVCHRPFVEVHHLVPEAQGGKSSIENAAPLCARCHDLYGGNPEKRKALRQMRDDWWNKMELRNRRFTETSECTAYEILEDVAATGGLRQSRSMLYHRVFPREGFEQAANDLLELVCEAQRYAPNHKRLLWLDIDGHRTKKGWFDQDMAELQLVFLQEFLIQYVSEVHAPLIRIRNKGLQDNTVPEGLRFFKQLDEKSIQDAIREGIDGIWVGGKNVMLRIDKCSVPKTRPLPVRKRGLTKAQA